MAGHAGPTSASGAMRDGTQVAWQRAAGGRFMVEAEVGGQRVAGMRLAERIGSFVSHLFNNRHGGELVSSNGGVTNASSICKHTVHVFR